MSERDDIRRQLVDAARELFLTRGFTKTSSREIARAAGVAPAMIHYYFDDKAGLFEAIVTQALQPVATELQRQATRRVQVDTATLIATYMRVIAGNPWLPTLMLNEVLAGDGRLREQFIRNVASKLAPLLVGLVQRERAAGRLRAGMDPRFVVVSMLSLCVFPFVARALLTSVLNLSYEPQSIERLIEHTMQVFNEGVGVKR